MSSYVYIDMNYYFAKAVNANPNIKNLVSNTCDIGGGAIQYDESWEHFYNNIFTPSNLFLTDDRDIELCNILRDAKKFTYQSDNLIYELPITEEEFIEKYVNNIDGYPMLSQLIIIELFYIHYKLEDDCLKFELIMETIRNLSEQEEGSPYSLACMLYAYIVLAKIMFDRIACEDSVYPADYWGNE